MTVWLVVRGAEALQSGRCCEREVRLNSGIRFASRRSSSSFFVPQSLSDVSTWSTVVLLVLVTDPFQHVHELPISAP